MPASGWEGHLRRPLYAQGRDHLAGDRSGDGTTQCETAVGTSGAGARSGRGRLGKAAEAGDAVSKWL